MSRAVARPSGGDPVDGVGERIDPLVAGARITQPAAPDRLEERDDRLRNYRREAHQAPFAPDDVAREEVLVARAHDRHPGRGAANEPPVLLVRRDLPAPLLDGDHPGQPHEPGQGGRAIREPARAYPPPGRA